MTDVPDHVLVTDANVRGLAHPLRVHLLGLLRTYGPATASSLAAELSLTSGALSYHLRQLERYGFIVEDTERGNRRERWWRAAHQSTQFEMGSGADEGRLYEDALVQAMVRGVERSRAALPALPIAWQRAFSLSDVLLRLTPAETEQLNADLLALLRTYRGHQSDGPVPDGARVVSAQFQILPLPDPTAMGERS